MHRMARTFLAVLILSAFVSAQSLTLLTPVSSRMPSGSQFRAADGAGRVYLGTIIARPARRFLRRGSVMLRFADPVHLVNADAEGVIRAGRKKQLIFLGTTPLIAKIADDENPATSTRWCFPSGQSVTLVANDQAISVCPPPIVCEGFAWVSVGNPGTLVPNIVNGYAKGSPGTDASDMAFNGTLNIYGGFSDSSIPFYQVWAGFWTGNDNPARGGTPPATAAPISLPLTAQVVIFRQATLSMEFDTVSLAPCSFMGIDNLYMTTSQRMTPPAGVTGLGPTPTLNPGDFVVTWSDAGRLVGASAAALISPQAGGGIDLYAVPYDAAGTQLFMVNNNPLTLMIDTRDLSRAVIDSLLAFDKNGNSVGLTGSSTTECPAYHIGPDGFLLLHVTVTDSDPSPGVSINEHLSGYQIDTQFGHGSTSVPTSPAHRGYAQAPGTFTGVDGGYGVPNTAQVSFVGGGDTIQVNPKVSCCYDFQLWAGKRTTDGQDFFGTWGNYDFQTATIDVSPIV
jgi:hypothetical protein